MVISSRSAQQIVQEMQGIIHQHINMMDHTGTIIASTDPDRIGTFHEGALQVVSRRLPLLIVRDDNEYKGTRKGTNLPLVLEDDYIGVIGITGEPDEVADYGRIIQRMTEILLLDSYTREQRRIAEQVRNRYLEEWLFEPGRAADSAFIQRGESLGIWIRLPRRVMLVKVISPDGPEGPEQPVFNQAEKMVKRMIIAEPDCHFLRMSSFLVCMVTKRNDAEMALLARRVGDAISGIPGVAAAVGIDSWQSGEVPIQTGYARAVKALRACEATRQAGITFYDAITIEIFLSEISPASKREFVLRMFRNCPKGTVRRWTELLGVFYACDGSLIRASQQLYMHKNTLQQKLNKLWSLTGLDPRRYQDAALYVLALQFYMDLSDMDEI